MTKKKGADDSHDKKLNLDDEIAKNIGQLQRMAEQYNRMGMRERAQELLRHAAALELSLESDTVHNLKTDAPQELPAGVIDLTARRRAKSDNQSEVAHVPPEDGQEGKESATAGGDSHDPANDATDDDHTVNDHTVNNDSANADAADRNNRVDGAP